MHFMDGVAAEDRSELEVEFRAADAAAVVAARAYLEEGYPGFSSAEGVAYMAACRRLEVASSARFAARTGSFSRALEAGLSFDEYRDARAGLS